MPVARRPLLAIALVCLGCGAGGGQPPYQVQRSARILPPVPNMQSAAPMAEATELSASTGVVTVAEPNENDSGNRIARTWLDAALRRRVTPHLDVAVLGEAAPPLPSIRVSDSDMPAVAKEIPFALGAGVRTALGDGRGLNLGLSGDLMAHSAPAALIAHCAPEYCAEEPPRSWSGRTSAVMLRLAVVPTWVGERVSWFAGASLRNAQWLPRDKLSIGGPPHLVDLDFGWSVVLAAGAEIPLGERLRLQAVVAQPLEDPGAAFGPLVSLGLTVALSRRETSARQAPPHGGSP